MSDFKLSDSEFKLSGVENSSEESAFSAGIAARIPDPSPSNGAEIVALDRSVTLRSRVEEPKFEPLSKQEPAET